MCVFCSHCDEFITEQAKSVVYASNRMDVPELVKVRDLLVAKYTKTILPDREVGVYPRLVLKLSMSYPERGLCEKYLEAIADNFGVDWSAEEGNDDDDEEEDGEEVENDIEDEESKLEMLKTLSPTNSISIPNSLRSNSPAQSASSSVTSSHETLPPPPAYADVKSSPAPLPMDYSKQAQHPKQQQNNNLPDFDEFTRRFEALRKK